MWRQPRNRHQRKNSGGALKIWRKAAIEMANPWRRRRRRGDYSHHRRGNIIHSSKAAENLVISMTSISNENNGNIMKYNGNGFNIK